MLLASPSPPRFWETTTTGACAISRWGDPVGCAWSRWNTLLPQALHPAVFFSFFFFPLYQSVEGSSSVTTMFYNCFFGVWRSGVLKNSLHWNKSKVQPVRARAGISRSSTPTNPMVVGWCQRSIGAETCSSRRFLERQIGDLFDERSLCCS